MEVVDYKTGKPKDEKAAKNSLQLSIYAMAARDVLDLDPERLVFYNLTTNQAVATTRDAKSLDKARERVAEVADRIRAKDFPAQCGIPVPLLRLPAAVPGTRTVGYDSRGAGISAGWEGAGCGVCGESRLAEIPESFVANRFWLHVT